MTLHAYLGRAGTGKSTKMLTEIKQKMKQDPLGDPNHFNCSNTKYISIRTSLC